MTKDEIIRMAREAGFDSDYFDNVECSCDECNFLKKPLERFAALVAAHEREKQAEQEPVAIGSVLQKVMARLCDLLDEDQFANIEAIVNAGGYAAPVEPVNQEPVIGAYEVVNEKGDEWSLVYPAAVHRYKSIPEERITQTFYAAPVRTKDLTGDELSDLMFDYEPCENPFKFARAVIAAYKEKNK